MAQSSWHFKFPKVVQAHALGEVGILGTALLRVYNLFQDNPSNFLPRDASAERGYEIACRPSVRLSVCPSVCNDQVPWSHRLQFLENNFTAK